MKLRIRVLVFILAFCGNFYDSNAVAPLSVGFAAEGYIIVSPSTDTIRTLDTLDYSLGNVVTVLNKGTAFFTVRAADANTVLYLPPKSSGRIVCKQAPCDSEDDWEGLSPIVSEWIDNSSFTIDADTTAPTLAATNIRNYKWRRVGDSMEIHVSYSHTSSSGTGAGSGVYLFPLPGSFAIDTAKIQLATDGALHQTVGSAAGYTSGAGGLTGHVWAYSYAKLALKLGNDTNSFTSLAHSNYSITGSVVGYNFEATVPISGWKAMRN